MGTQSNDRGGENRQTQQPGRPDEKRDERRQGQGQEQDSSRQAQAQDQDQDQAQDQGRVMKSDDDVGGDVDTDGEINQPGQSGNQDRERSGSTRSRNP